MAVWFDENDTDDTNLLHSDVRSHAEIGRVADEVELDVVDYFTTTGQPTLENRVAGQTTPYWFIENGVAYTVELYGFAPDPADAAGYDANDRADWSDFAEAFRATIAHVLGHRLRHYDELYGIQSERHGRESWTYKGSRDLRWPPNWKRRLKKYITKPPVYSV